MAAPISPVAPGTMTTVSGAPIPVVAFEQHDLLTVNIDDIPLLKDAFVGDGLGLRCGSFDLGAGCAGFVYELVTGAALLTAGHMDHVLVIGAETLSRVVDPGEVGDPGLGRHEGNDEGARPGRGLVLGRLDLVALDQGQGGLAEALAGRGLRGQGAGPDAVLRGLAGDGRLALQALGLRRGGVGALDLVAAHDEHRVAGPLLRRRHAAQACPGKADPRQGRQDPRRFARAMSP